MYRTAFSTPTRMPKGREAIRSQESPRNAKGERQRSKKIPAIKRVSQTGKLNVGNGRNGSRARMARTLGLYVDKKSCVASSATPCATWMQICRWCKSLRKKRRRKARYKMRDR